MLRNKKLLYTVLFFALLLLSGFSLIEDVAYSEKDAKDAINATQRSIIKCYEAALEAEKAGANVTSLLQVLNDAGKYLSQAIIEYERENFSRVVELTRQVQNDLEGFIPEAEKLKDEVLEQSYRDFMINIVGSSVGAAAVICISLTLWIRLKKRHISQREESR